MARDRGWWTRPGMLLTGVVFVTYGAALQLSRDPHVTGFWALLAALAGVSVLVFNFIPWSTCMFRIAGILGFLLWGGQSSRLLVMMLDGGVDDTDWRTFAGMLAYGYFALVFWVMWNTYVKAWHNDIWAKRQVRKERRG